MYLPTDLLVEILSRVPEASLARLRYTSKEWKALIKKDARLVKKSLVIILIDCRVYLARLNLLNDNIVEFFFERRRYTPRLSLRWPIAMHHHGRRLVVWNPRSGETSRIIKPRNIHKGSDTYALGKSSCNNEYKILRVNHSGNGFSRPCLAQYEIYDFTSNSWRLIGEDRECSFPGHWLHGGTSVDGNTYWLSLDFSQDSQRPRDFIQCFDFSTERFGLVSLPGDHLSYYPFALSVTREEQKLCLLTSCHNLLHINVWMATKIKGTGDMSWSKLLSVKRTSSYQFFSLWNGMSFLADRENKVILHPIKYKDSSKFLHIVGEDKYIKVDLHDVGSKHLLPVSCVPTLAQIQQGSFGVATWKAPITKL
ncbi:putative F-box protein [Raphanus sativus]|nr:putative F-box protein [Raphanus sativus]